MALSGDLGSGKTVFTKGIALGLGVKDDITSPTFVVIKQYKIDISQISPVSADGQAEVGNLKSQSCGRGPCFLFHIDCYRITDVKDAESIGLREYLDIKDNILIIEWAENIESLLPKSTKFIRFENLGQNKRRITATRD